MGHFKENYCNLFQKISLSKKKHKEAYPVYIMKTLLFKNYLEKNTQKNSLKNFQENKMVPERDSNSCLPRTSP